MDIIRRTIIILFGLAFGITMSILVMMNGWGLEPKSWWWIIGISLASSIMSQLIIHVGTSKK